MKSYFVFSLLMSLLVTKSHAAPYKDVMELNDFIEVTKVAFKPKGNSYLEVIDKLKDVHHINGNEKLKAESLIELYKLTGKYIKDHPESKRNPGMEKLLSSIVTVINNGSAEPSDSIINRFYDEQRANIQLQEINVTESQVVDEYGIKFTIKYGESLTQEEKGLALKVVSSAAKKIKDIRFPEEFNNAIVIGVGKDEVTQAFSGENNYTIILGKNLWRSNPMVEGVKDDIPGGLGINGFRGIADIVGDDPNFKNAELASRGEAIVVHELAHLIHQAINPTEYWSEKYGKQTGGDNDWMMASEHVSLYATQNKLEFVAEAITQSVYNAGEISSIVNNALGNSLETELILHCRQ